MDYTLKQLKEIAAKIGLTHSPNISINTLTDKIVAHLEDTGTTIDDIANELGFTMTKSVEVDLTPPTLD